MSKTEIVEFEKQLSDQDKKLSAALPPGVDAQRFIRVAVNAVVRNPDLLTRCDRGSLFIACMEAAEDGLLPDGREGAIVPYKGRARWTPMVAGLTKLAWQSGMIAALDAEAVYEGETFRVVRGTNPHIEHELDGARRGDGRTLDGVTAVYAVAHLASGRSVFSVMYRNDIDRLRKRSAANNGPWTTDAVEMAKVRPIRRLSKLLPNSGENFALRFLNASHRADVLEDTPEEPEAVSPPEDRMAALEAAITVGAPVVPTAPEPVTIDAVAEAPAAPIGAPPELDASEEAAAMRVKATRWVRAQTSRIDNMREEAALFEWERRSSVIASRENLTNKFPDLAEQMSAVVESARARLQS